MNLAFLGYSVGEHATWLAIAFYALQQGGPSAVGAVTALQLVPGVLLTPFSSYAGDRFRPRRALAAGYAVQCVSMAATSWCMVSDRHLLAYLAGSVAATAISFTRPVMGSLLPTVTHAPSDLVAANVVAGGIEQLGLFGGPLLAGVVMTSASPAAVFAIAAGLTGCGCVAVASMRGDHDEHPEHREHRDDRARSSVAMPSGRDAVAQLFAGFAALRSARMLRLLLAFVLAAGVVRGVGDVVFVTFADERLHGGGGASGYLAVLYGVGGLVAAASITRLVGGRRVSPPFVVAGVIATAGMASLAVVSGYATAGPGFVLLGAGDALLMITAVVTIQRLAPTDVLARVFGIVEGLQMGCVAVGSSAMAALTSWRSLGTAFMLLGAVLATVVLAAVIALRRHGDEIPPVDHVVVDRLLADPVFSPLPAPVIERLARAAGRVRYQPGRRIVTEGELGDRYFLVVSGEVEITIGGRHVRVLGPGRSFGEIALLRDVPRTATATATTMVEVLTVDRNEFLTSVTGHPRSFGVASGVADTWLAND
ncbi:MAG: MFS transporter [Acidimicrobiales bacterium]